MQLLLVRHALPLRSEHGQGSDPDLSAEGLAQVERLPDALARFPISRVVSSPQRRAIQTAEPVADRARADRRDRRSLRRVRPRPAGVHPVEQIRAEKPAGMGAHGAGTPAQRGRRGRISWPGARGGRRPRRRRRPRGHRRGVQPRRGHQRPAARHSAAPSGCCRFPSTTRR